MRPEMLALLDWDQSLRDALEARDGERAGALVHEWLSGWREASSAEDGGLSEKHAAADILARNLALAQQVQRSIRADLAVIRQQRRCAGGAQMAPVGSCCHFSA